MTASPISAPAHDPDGPHVLRREFSLWSAFAFAFAFISPIVALYGIFGLALAAAGPSFWWGFALVFGGQLLVALVFAMLVSRWPLEGSIYQWSRRLLGTSYGWFAGWVYMWTLVIAMATVALGAAGFVANIAGVESPSGGLRAVIALMILLGGTAINLIGRGALKVFMTASIVAEVIGSIGLGTWLLVFHRNNSLSVLFDGGGPGRGHLELPERAVPDRGGLHRVLVRRVRKRGRHRRGGARAAAGSAQGGDVLAGVHRVGGGLLELWRSSWPSRIWMRWWRVPWPTRCTKPSRRHWDTASPNRSRCCS